VKSYIHSIETKVPPFVYQQSEIEEMFQSRIEDRKIRMLLRRSLRGSGIETRHSVCEGFFSGELFDDQGRASTADRNRIYARESRKLAGELGRKLLGNSPTFSAGDITHVVFASCTGFVNPGPDYHLIEDLGLRSDVQRFVLGFMGCYAAVPALRMAKHICESDPEANVLVMCLELCSLHLHVEASYDSVLANSLFADGAAAALVSSRKPFEEAVCGAELGKFYTEIIPEGEVDMSWEIGDQGFDLVLSNRVPEMIESRVGQIVKSIAPPDSIDQWAIHPGGKGIVDKVEAAVPVAPEKLIVSRDVMRRYGNMASATVLFVIKELLEEANSGDQMLSVAFGPGLTVEAGMLRKC
jgi:predicted naringenin-chalcone synthase